MVTPDRRLDRAALHAALGEPVRLAIVDELAASDRAPGELCGRMGISSNLLAHHLGVLEGVGLVDRSRSSGDGRRRYVRLRRDRLGDLGVGCAVSTGPAMFVCTANSARSQLAAALWQQLTDAPATSAGTHPSLTVHPEAIAAADRAGLDVSHCVPAGLPEAADRPALVVTVCDRVHEELDAPDSWLHWSVPDPVATGTPAAFDRTVGELHERISSLLAGTASPN